MSIKSVLSWFVPQRVYVDGVKIKPVEAKISNGEAVMLHHHQTLGEDVVYTCFDKKTNAMRGFIVKNIKYGFFGELCNTVQEAIASANEAWFRFMGVKQRQRQK